MGGPPKFVRFLDLSPSTVNVDFQVHTSQTDGDGAVRDVLEAARRRSVSAIAFTEHVRKDTNWFPQFADEILIASADYPEIRIYVGCETKALDASGLLDVSDQIYDRCDIVLGSVHRFPNGSGGYLDFREMSAKQTADMEFELALGMLRGGRIDVLSHPGGMYERRYGAFPERYFRELMIEALKSETAVEINSSYLFDPGSFLRLCAEINPIVSIGSDVHKLDEMGRCRDMLRMRGIGSS
jgi:putative hydrolase